MSEFEARMRAAGMSGAEAAKKSAVLDRLGQELRELRAEPVEQPCAFFVPGRVELAGKHTDYGGGRSLVCAVERGICLLASARTDRNVRMAELERRPAVEFALDPNAEAAGDEFANYGLTVARRIARDFPGARTGADIVFASDLPAASGMSSSSALVVGVFCAIAGINHLSTNKAWRCVRSREDMAGYLGAVESGESFGAFSGGKGVGTLGGSEDHVAILCSRAGFARQYSYCPIRLEREVRLPRDYALIVGVSGVKAEKTGNARDSYNRISMATRKIVEVWREATGCNDASLAAASESSPDATDRLRELLRNLQDTEFGARTLLDRLMQFKEESDEIVPGLSEALARGEMERAGLLADRSQHLAKTCLGNQTPETVELQRSARRLGASAASAFGAGFGGSVWALVEERRATEFRDSWATHYGRSFPRFADPSNFLITSAGPGVIQFGGCDVLS